MRVRFEEVDEQAEGHVGDHEEFENVAGVSCESRVPSCELRAGNAFERGVEKRNPREQEEDFVELRRVAADAVAEVDAPGQMCGNAIGVVGEASEEAADAADGDAGGERDRVEVAGGLAESDVALDEFDREQTADEASDDGFAADEISRVVQVVQRELRVFEPEQELRAEGCAGDGGGETGPAERREDGVAETAVEEKVDAERDDIRERFEEKVRVDGVGAEVEVDGEGDCGLECVEDGEL